MSPLLFWVLPWWFSSWTQGNRTSGRKRGIAGTGRLGSGLALPPPQPRPLTILIQNIGPHLYLSAPHLWLDVRVRLVAWDALFKPANVFQYVFRLLAFWIDVPVIRYKTVVYVNLLSN